MYKMLIVEDDPTIADEVAAQIAPWGIEAKKADDLRNVMQVFAKFQPHIVLLDISLPFFNGYHWCEQIRAVSKVPVIFISSASDNMNIVMAMNLGADDFVSKPFSMLELIARIRAVLRRAEPAQTSGDFSLGLLFVSPDRHEVKAGGKDVMLTNKEFELLCLLLRNKGIVLTRATLMDRVWGFESERENRTLDVHIRTLRVKLGEAGSYIETVRGIGYKIGGEDL